jgi:hypothetical protein
MNVVPSSEAFGRHEVAMARILALFNRLARADETAPGHDAEMNEITELMSDAVSEATDAWARLTDDPRALPAIHEALGGFTRAEMAMASMVMQ